MTYCAKPGCKFAAWRRLLCYFHWKQSQGFVFDSERKVFVRAEKKIA